MDTQKEAIALKCLKGAESNSMTFPQVVSTLMRAGFEGYSVDFRRGMVAYYSPCGETVEFSGAKPTPPVAVDFDASAVKEAIREAQTLVPGYTYQGFITKVAGAGCAGYMVSFLGRRVLYFARSAETHIEHFPQ
ncbi:MAG TPA: DUF1398 family protein [Steroidobacteraceae bacterium]|jgi:uncharacterized protein YbcV (DUF1398 family)|nr:DUF1398 family protein [Steroidobacteraceae bacterium]